MRTIFCEYFNLFTNILKHNRMEKKKYLTPEMRVRPVFTENSLMDFSINTNEQVDTGLAKEGSDLNYHPEFKDVWAD